MNNVIGIAIENWPHEKRKAATDWLLNLYGPPSAGVSIWSQRGVGYKWKEATWYTDLQPAGCEDLIMRKDIYFMFCAAFGENYGSTN
jgi:hypothetical protein